MGASDTGAEPRGGALRPARISRRGVLAGLGAALSGPAPAPALVRRAGARPGIPSGVQCGEVSDGRAVIWSRADRPARMVVEWSTRESLRDARRVVGPSALEAADFTARVELEDLPPGEQIFYRVTFMDPAEPALVSEPVAGRFRTAPVRPRGVLFAWSADVCGQGWGIDPSRGGMRAWETIRKLEPDFFLHSGDAIYADNPLEAAVPLEDGTLWRNLLTPAKTHVAETLADFRGCYAYNLLDENLRRFCAEVPLLVQWDDHEVLNNWYPGERLADDPRYREKDVDLLAARARRAFFDFMPLRRGRGGGERIYRSCRYGPLLEVFLLDCRSYRAPNSGNRQSQPGRETEFLGPAQIAWLKRGLRASPAIWKVIASDMPLGLVIGDGPGRFEAVANGDGPPLGRELEIAALLRFLRDERIRNVVWLTGDVHYAAAHYYDPSRARFAEFLPFWEFVAGPLHAGTFGPAALDDTFGPQVRFTGIPAGMKPNRPPSEGLQFFGTVRIDGATRVMTVSLWNAAGSRLYSLDLAPEP